MQPCGDLFVGHVFGYEPEYVGLPVGDAVAWTSGEVAGVPEWAAPQRERLDPVPGERACRDLQPLPRLAPAVCQRRLFGGVEPGQVGPDRVVAQVTVGGKGQFGGLVPVPGAAGEDRVGVAEDPPVDPVGGQAGPPGVANRGRRVGVAVRGQ